MIAMLFDGWGGIAHVLVVGTLAYACLIVVLRVTGKRTLSKMNAFDLIVTVALGSALATTMLSKTTPLLEGVAALALLVFLQFMATWLSVRSSRFQSVIKAQPRLLAHRGEFLGDALIAERVTKAEVLAAIRNEGRDSLDGLSVVLETDGSLSVVAGSGKDAAQSSLANVRESGAGRGGPSPVP